MVSGYFGIRHHLQASRHHKIRVAKGVYVTPNKGNNQPGNDVGGKIRT